MNGSVCCGSVSVFVCVCAGTDLSKIMGGFQNIGGKGAITAAFFSNWGYTSPGPPKVYLRVCVSTLIT